MKSLCWVKISQIFQLSEIGYLLHCPKSHAGTIPHSHRPRERQLLRAALYPYRAVAAFIINTAIIEQLGFGFGVMAVEACSSAFGGESGYAQLVL